MAAAPYAIAQEQNLLTILAHDNKNGKIVARLIEPELFQGEYREVAERLKAYWLRWGKAPGAHAADLFSDILDDEHNRRRKTYLRILRNMEALNEGINTEYVLYTLRTQARRVRIQDAILKAAETLNAKQDLGIEETEEILSVMLRARVFEFDKGITLRDVDKVMDFIESHYSEFRTGIGPFDRRNIVPARGAVFLLLSPTGLGKTWGLVHIGKHGILQRKRVLHITLEMSAEETMQRYYMDLFSLSKHAAETEVSTFETDEYDKLVEVGKVDVVRPGFTFDDPKARRKLRRRVEKFDRSLVDSRRNLLADRLVVKRFPPRGLTVPGLCAYLDALEASGFIPDMCVLDYVGIMNTDTKNLRISLGRVMEDFRGVMVERNMAGVTAHQVSKAGAKANVVKATHVAEDWSLIHSSDVAVTFSQTVAEQKVGLARLLVAKARSEADKFGVVITQSYDLGQFVLQAAMLNRVYMDHQKELRGNEDEEDEEE